MIAHLLLNVLIIISMASSLPVTAPPAAAVDKGIDMAPQFLLMIRSCINLKEKNEARRCLLQFTRDEEVVHEIMESNAVWGLVGNVSLQETQVKFSLNSHLLTERILTMNLVLHKAGLSFEQISSLGNSCNGSSQDGVIVKLTLNDTLVNTIRLSPSELAEEKWIFFRPLKSWFLNWLQKNAMLANGSNILQIGIAAECPTLSLKELGITFSKGYQPLLAMYANVTDTDQDPRLNLIQKLEKLLSNESSGDKFPAEQKKNAEQQQKRNTEQRQITTTGIYVVDPALRCHLINYSVPYSFIGSPQTGTFELNFCAGHCHYPVPLKTSVNHSIIAALLNAGSYRNVDIKPHKPDCVPIEYVSLVTLRPHGPSEYVMTELDKVTATKCGCR